MLILILILFIIITSLFIQVREFITPDNYLISIKDKLKPFFDPKNVTFKGILKGLNDGNIIDKIPISKGEKSYTINKEKIYICLKDEEKEYYDENMLIYVILHEIGHVLCKSEGHTQEWHTIFKALQNYANKRGFWDAKEPIINNYCEVPNDPNDDSDPDTKPTNTQTPKTPIV